MRQAHTSAVLPVPGHISENGHRRRRHTAPAWSRFRWELCRKEPGLLHGRFPAFHTRKMPHSKAFLSLSHILQNEKTSGKAPETASLSVLSQAALRPGTVPALQSAALTPLPLNKSADCPTALCWTSTKVPDTFFSARQSEKKVFFPFRHFPFPKKTQSAALRALSSKDTDKISAENCPLLL